MMKSSSVATLVLFYLCMAMLVSHGFARDLPNAKETDTAEPNAEEIENWFHPLPRGPRPHPPINLSKPVYPWALPPLPAHKLPPWAQARAKCFSAFHEMNGCVSDIKSSLRAGKYTVGASCCKAYIDIKEDCPLAATRVSKLPLFHLVIEPHCSKQAAPPSKA